ncbi:hypothetical protein GO986_16260 [Deinococcus sp. HMF7620]|uniref:Lipoprotein n=1 Tax=Deinococcus arboris TaxID=2682977 RepID=A0A7C9LWC3_9DEIO|nr:hypothetical protein [Deinococcus arboris]MVN88300.1 hypothetical protein [Deinococcus arboris]
MRQRLLLFLLPFLSGCSFTAPPRDEAQWSSTVHGVAVTWRWTAPGALSGADLHPGQVTMGATHAAPGGTSCVIDIDPAASRYQLPRVAAHEVGHCLQARYLKVGGDPRSTDPYLNQTLERWPEAYAQAYLTACGPSLVPLGWRDAAPATCTAPPHPDDVPAGL